MPSILHETKCKNLPLLKKGDITVIRNFENAVFFASEDSEKSAELGLHLITNYLCEIFSLSTYCAFHKHANSEVQKPTDDCVFAAINHLNGPLRTQNFTLTGSKGHGF